MRLCARTLVHLLALCSFWIASAASAVTLTLSPVGDAGNACDTQATGCFGSVATNYWMGTYEVTNAQYTEFLNAKAVSDPLGLYNLGMGGPVGGILRSGSDGSYVYTAIPARASRAVDQVSVYDAMRFANWMNNGQGTGDTETGAYTLLGGTATPANGLTVTRNVGAVIFLPSEDEWYKAAYYDPNTAGYFDYPAGSNTQTGCSLPTATPNRANCGNAVGAIMNVGSYPGSASPYGTFDQGGNVWEWNETILNGIQRGFRGGNLGTTAANLAASAQRAANGSNENGGFGFRLATTIPEPGTGLLLAVGLLGFAMGRRRN